MEPSTLSIGRMASHGVLWSIVRSWSSRLITFVIFIILANFLTPHEYGIASAAYICIIFVGILAEFGFGDAIIQRKNLLPEQINLPFFASLFMSSAFAIAIAISSPVIERLIKAPGSSPIIIALAGVAPLTTISLFQDFNYRKNLAFRALALRVLVANGIAGIAAIACAYAGWGIWSLVIQSYITVVVGAIWLWRRPYWVPSSKLDFTSFKEISRFGSSVVILRIIEFAATRLIDIIILWRFGASTLGLYAVGSRIYLTLMQILQGALNDVALPVLSRISEDRKRIRAAYLQTIKFAAYLGTPIFVVCAAVSHELCLVLFGGRWVGVDQIAVPLLILGAVQCVQYLDGSFMSARGKPGVVLCIGSVRYFVMIIGLSTIPAGDAITTVSVFVALQLAVSPIGLIVVCREFDILSRQVILKLLPPFFANVSAFLAVGYIRNLASFSGSVFFTGAILGLIFLIVYVSLVILLARSEFFLVLGIIKSKLNRKRERISPQL